jgi:hypothetical protein
MERLGAPAPPFLAIREMQGTFPMPPRARVAGSFWECLMSIRSSLLAASLSLVSQAALGQELFAKSYDMLNGETGSFTYWDDSYNGSGNPSQSGSLLTGGLGDLTDGIIASQNWFATPGPYVGWNSITPTITFRFADVSSFESISLFLDDSNGSGGVAPPSVVRISVGGGAAIDFPVADPASGEPFEFQASLDGALGDTVDITLIDGLAQWVFLSEVKFNGVPTPGALAGLSIAALGLGRRRR